MSCDARMMETESRVISVQTIAGHMEDALEITREVGDPGRCLTCGKKCSAYVTCLYIFVKVLYLLNAVAQLFLLNSFLGTQNLMYGFYLLNDLLQGYEWQRTGQFPRVTMCDFEVCSCLSCLFFAFLFLSSFFTRLSYVLSYSAFDYMSDVDWFSASLHWPMPMPGKTLCCHCRYGDNLPYG